MRAGGLAVMLLGTPTVPLVMDELDRLYRRLVHNVHASAPELLGRPFEVSQIYQHLVPYRTNRREMEFTTNDEYELALCQLLAGARGLLAGDEEMQASLRRELESPSPDLSAYRAFAASLVAFTPEPLREVMLRPTPERAQSAGGSASPAEQAVMAARATEAVATPPDSLLLSPQAVPVTSASPYPAPRAAPPPGAALPAPTAAGAEHVPSAFSPASMPVARPNPVRANPGEACRYCGAALPEGRSIVFCPGCGHNLTIKQCPACNTELEVGWKFCVTCGREV